LLRLDNISLRHNYAIMSRTRQITQLAMVVGLEAGALVWLLSLGRRSWLRIRWSEFGTWLRVTPTDDALAAFVWLVTLGCVVWLAGSTLLYLAARASRVPALIGSVEWMTLPAIRRVSERVFGAILVASTMAAIPVRADPPPPVIIVSDTDGAFLPPGISGRVPEQPREFEDSIDTNAPPLPAFPNKNPATLDEGRPTEVAVQTGDNLWIMCRRHLTDALGRRPTNEEIAPYWRKVIMHNEPNLISRDADLIYAGEVIAMLPTS